MTVVDIPNFEGALILQATTGCTITCNSTFTVAAFDRTDKEFMTVTLNFVSDGEVTFTWDETGSGPTDIQGNNASVTTPAGFNLHQNQWTASLNVDLATATFFDSRWKSNKPGNGELTGTIVGVVRFDAANTEPVPTL